MADRRMIFSAPMVRALLDGRKTQTRRLLSSRDTLFDGRPWPKGLFPRCDWSSAWVDPGPSPAGNPGPYLKVPWPNSDDEVLVARVYPMFQPGDRIWVQEAICNERRRHGLVAYRADHPHHTPGSWCSPIYMPRWASRITLTVTEVKVQRVQEISEEDALAEGVARLVGSGGPNHFSREICGKWSGSFNAPTAQDVYADLWTSIHGPAAWEANPWVCAISFTAHKENIDA